METVRFLCLGLITAVALPAAAQTVFRNLDFELARIPASTPPGSLVPVADALPGWTCYLGTNQQSEVRYNGFSIGSADIALIDSGAGVAPIQGDYFVRVTSGVDFSSGTARLVPAAIAQTGVIPENTKSLLFAALDPSYLVVTLGGVTIPFSLYSQSSDVITYGGDISEFAGQTAELRFTEINDGFSGVHAVFLDSIRFSALPVPVPLSIAAMSTNTVLLSWPSRTNTFSVQVNSGLKAGNWVTLTNEPAAAGYRSQVTLPMPNEAMFYRKRISQ